MSLKQYLESEAAFISPEPNSSQQSTTGINDTEVARLGPEWKPTEARRDTHLVNSLIEVLNSRIGDTPIPERIVQEFESIKMIGQRFWKRNEQEADASRMVDRVLPLAALCLELLGYRFDYSGQVRAPNSQSIVDFLFHDDAGKKVVVEIKSPGVFRFVEQLCCGAISAFPLRLLAPRTMADKVISKLCFYMGAHQTQWGVLTCHDKWLFVRLQRRSEPKQTTYITFSSVEHQTSNTRPFRALLGMTLAAKEDIDVESHADLGVQLSEIAEEEELPGAPSPQSSFGQSDESHDPTNGSSDESSQGRRSEPPELRPRRSVRSTPDIFLAWSQDVTFSNEWLSLYSVDGADGCPSIGCKPARLRLQREIGRGSTACVYEAKPDNSEQDYQTYAIKVVKKGTSEEEKGHLAGIYQEFRVYRIIEKARSEGRRVYVTPRCYGLYETALTVSLVMDYVGESLVGIEWGGLSQFERQVI